MRPTAVFCALGVALAVQPGVAQVLMPAEVVGCYDLRFEAWDSPTGAVGDSLLFRPPPRVFFDTIGSEFPGYFRVLPAPDSRPSPHRHAFWMVEGERVVGMWSTASSGVSVSLTRDGDAFSGTVKTFRDVRPSRNHEASIVAAPIPCDAPPEYPLKESRLLPRSVSLSSGVVVELGKPVPDFGGAGEQTGPRRFEFTGESLGPFSGGTHVKAWVTDGGLVGTIVMEFSGEIPQAIVVERLEEAIGFPAERGSRPESGLHLWGDAMTGLLVMRHGSYFTVNLSDPRIY